MNWARFAMCGMRIVITSCSILTNKANVFAFVYLQCSLNVYLFRFRTRAYSTHSTRELDGSRAR